MRDLETNMPFVLKLAELSPIRDIAIIYKRRGSVEIKMMVQNSQKLVSFKKINIAVIM